MARGSDVNPVAVASVGVGLVFIWTGVKGGSVLKTFQSLVQGKQPAGDLAYPVTTPLGSGSSSGGDSSSSTGSSTDQLMDAPAGGTVAQNKAIAKQLAAKYGWDTGAQWDALVWLWQHESSWDNHADNPSSHAYGIAQAYPYSKMPKAAWPESAGGSSNASVQISWGLSYIKDRYHDPLGAQAFWRAHNWY